MRLALVGVGNAGSRIVNRILDVERATGRNLCNGNALSITSAPTEFDVAEHVPEEQRLVIGDVHREVDGRGTDGDPDLGAAVAREDRNEIVRAFDVLEFYEVDGVLVAAGLGGGTGGGAGAVVLDEMQAICDKPVYALALLPSEAEGSRPAMNAARSLQSFVATADNVIAFDNDAWGTGHVTTGGGEAAVDQSEEATAEQSEAGAVAGSPETEPRRIEAENVERFVWGDAERSAEPDEGGNENEVTTAEPPAGTDAEGFALMNAELATRIVTLFAAGEIDGPTVAENRMDPSDIMRTLATGGISSIGYAETDVSRSRGGLLSWLRGRSWLAGLFGGADGGAEEDPTGAAKINRLVRRAARSKLTLPCEISSADRALLMLSGPSRELSRRGFESGRYWLEQETDTVEVMAGDEPHNRSSTLSATILFSSVTAVPRIEQLKEQAVTA